MTNTAKSINNLVDSKYTDNGSSLYFGFTAVFIRSVRLEKAKDLIQTTDKSISEIAYAVGFNDPSWFSRAFKEEFGHRPSAIHK